MSAAEWTDTWKWWTSEVVHEQLAQEYLYEAALIKKGLLWPTILASSTPVADV